MRNISRQMSKASENSITFDNSDNINTESSVTISNENRVTIINVNSVTFIKENSVNITDGDHVSIADETTIALELPPENDSSNPSDIRKKVEKTEEEKVRTSIVTHSIF